MQNRFPLRADEKQKIETAQKLFADKKIVEALSVFEEIETQQLDLSAMQSKMHCLVELRKFSDAVDLCLFAHAIDPLQEWPLYWGCLSAVYCFRNQEIVRLGTGFVAIKKEKTPV